jgi:hypothetical protein
VTLATEDVVDAHTISFRSNRLTMMFVLAALAALKRDETHYSRTENLATVTWGKQTGIVMGKGEDIHPGAVVHVTGKMGADRRVEAKQIVTLTGYVQVK